ncbi:hypothetical protein KQI41_12210 [Tissierella pigra]|uniref:hypothetical protein n=1 Tax=Tissierella pigra TaxID=2607614 RepID=UPI001C1189F0|nr:hypothetical protein [Tissierella pigra]MBU5427180.1 hypothetical protein [Tissierella pigra]
MLETEKKNFTIEIEEYKKKLEKEINLVNSIIDKSVYVTKLQCDKEFSIDLEIWEKFTECVMSTKSLYPNWENTSVHEKEREKINESK